MVASGSGASAGVNGGYMGTGFGAELGTKKIGVRPEMRFNREQFSGGGNFVTTFAVGVVYRFGE